jgi:hypothetical protein
LVGSQRYLTDDDGRHVIAIAHQRWAKNGHIRPIAPIVKKRACLMDRQTDHQMDRRMPLNSYLTSSANFVSWANKNMQNMMKIIVIFCVVEHSYSIDTTILGGKKIRTN